MLHQCTSRIRLRAQLCSVSGFGLLFDIAGSTPHSTPSLDVFRRVHLNLSLGLEGQGPEVDHKTDYLSR